MHTLRIGIISIGAVLVLAAPAAPILAQGFSHPALPYACRAITHTLFWGSHDFYTGGEVSVLQEFLTAQGHYRGPVIGIFGPMTFAAVRSFQAAHGIPATGTVGPLTRAAIARIGCGTNPSPVPVPSAPILHSISPTQGPTGTTVTITGSGFGQNNTVLFDGMTAVDNARITSTSGGVCTMSYPPTCTPSRQTITFTVPDYLRPYCPPGSYCLLYVVETQPRAYQLSVRSEYGTSNTLRFVVTESGGQGGQILSLQGIDAPSELRLYQPGTWTVRTQNSGQALRYSVVWGDEYQANNSSIVYPGPSQVQSSATFTHSYARSGTYTPIFTVTDDYGHSVSTSATVVVTPFF